MSNRLLGVNVYIALFVLLPALLLILGPLYLLLVNRAAFLQTRDEVVVREPGKRFLGKPKPVIEEARSDFIFATISQAAYGHKPYAVKDSAETLDPDATLCELGWTQWPDFPDAALQAKFATVHLRVEVWSNPAENAVVVAFGGTVFSNGDDWKANLRWFLPDRNDQYTMVVRTFVDAFDDKYQHLQQEPDWRFLKNAHLYATGHSLGGGLAQQFAYSLPEAASTRVEHVYAFDPSPVTGYYSVSKSVREKNSETLAIDRIYERGEILSILRSLTSFFYPPSARCPTIRQVRYNLFSAWGAIAKHSIARLAFRLYRVSGPHRVVAPKAPN